MVYSFNIYLNLFHFIDVYEKLCIYVYENTVYRKFPYTKMSAFFSHNALFSSADHNISSKRSINIISSTPYLRLISQTSNPLKQIFFHL